MLDRAATRILTSPFGLGSYSAAEAGRLLRTSPRNIRRWMTGYSFKAGERTIAVPPLWQPQIPVDEGEVEIGFRDLIELRFVVSFVAAGVGLKAVRNCLAYAREMVGEERPFATRRFRTDGRTIFLDSQREAGGDELLDLKSRQYVLKQIIDRSFKDLDFDADAVVRWRPFHGKESIVIDPGRSFGQPIVTQFGVPTAVLADAVQSEGSAERVAALYEVPASLVREAVKFEEMLDAA